MLTYNFDEKSNDVINYAFAEARDLGHQFIGTEHLLLGLALIKGSKVNETFLYYRITAKDIRTELIKLMGEISDFEGIVDYTLRAKECLERSHQFAVKSNYGEILPEHLFMAILSDKQSVGYRVLTKLSLDMTKVATDYVMDLEEPSNLLKVHQMGAHEVKLMDFDQDYDRSLSTVIAAFCTDLTEWIKDRPDEEIVGREEEIDRLIQVLTRKQKNNPCLIGDPGVGKTAIVRGFAKRVAIGNVPENLKNARILEVNIGGLVSGTMYRGQFEERMNELIKLLTSDDRNIAFFDEIHHLIGTGATGEKSLDAIGMLKPYLASGNLRLIGTTTYQEYQKYIEPDQALVRRLLRIDVGEPSPEMTEKMLKRIKVHYETHHQVVITDRAVKTAIELAMRYILDRKLPDKAIDIIDEACSRKRSEMLQTVEIVEEIKYRLHKLKQEKEALILEMKFLEASKIGQEEKRILNRVEQNQEAKAIMSSRRMVVDQSEIEAVVSEWAKIPVNRLSTHDRDRLTTLESSLGSRVIGQPNAVATVSKALKRFRVGIKDPDKPMGSFLFVGPTGVGKTELAKAIAELYFGDEKNLIRLDMSEYTERFTLSKLIGSPPGYEGTKEGGILTNAISRMPYSVVVFDEIEKAHYEVTNILLQIMDEGKLTDGRGKTYDFKNALIIMTSNLGAEEPTYKQVGFGSSQADNDLEIRIREASKKYFRPEFINRLDEIVLFSPLPEAALSKIVEIKVGELTKLLEQRGIALTVDENVYDTIAKQSYDVVYGARPIARAIDRLIKDPLSELMLLTDALTEVHVEVVDGKIRLRGIPDVETEN